MPFQTGQIRRSPVFAGYDPKLGGPCSFEIVPPSFARAEIITLGWAAGCEKILIRNSNRKIVRHAGIQHRMESRQNLTNLIKTSAVNRNCNVEAEKVDL